MLQRDKNGLRFKSGTTVKLFGCNSLLWHYKKSKLLFLSFPEEKLNRMYWARNLLDYAHVFRTPVPLIFHQLLHYECVAIEHFSFPFLLVQLKVFRGKSFQDEDWLDNGRTFARLFIFRTFEETCICVQ